MIALDGSMIFAPLGHLWLSRLEGMKVGGRVSSELRYSSTCRKDEN
jgi:hypothetical protein